MRSSKMFAGMRRGRGRRRAGTGLLVLAVFTACAAAAMAGQQATPAGSGYKSAGGWGKTGTATGQFANASGIATDKAGNVYVADTDNNRVQVFSAKGAFLLTWGSAGNGAARFAGAGDVDIAPDGTVWVSDEGNFRAQQFSSAGAPQSSFATPDGIPRGIAVDADGNVLIAANGGKLSGVRRYQKTETGWAATGGLVGAGPYRADDVEASPDGSVYMVTASTTSADEKVRRYSPDGKPLGTIKLDRGDGQRGIAIDPDCNVWAADTANTAVAKYSPSGKRLATLSLPYIARDIAVGPKGDVYVPIQNAGIVHFVEDKSKPQAAAVQGRVSVAKKGARYVARVKFALPGVACPTQVDATASLSGKGIAGSAHVKVAAGKTTVIEIPLAKGPLAKAAGTSATATFKIVLKTNGRPTRQAGTVRVSVPASAK